MGTELMIDLSVVKAGKATAPNAIATFGTMAKLKTTIAKLSIEAISWMTFALLNERCKKGPFQ